MQRLFSTFPSGWPGCGLLILRAAGSTPLFMAGINKLAEGTLDAAVGFGLCNCLAGTLMLLGLWTPFTASFQAIVEGVLAFTGPEFNAAHLIHSSIGMSLLMLGPGGWSIDARLYGRKRIDLRR